MDLVIDIGNTRIKYAGFIKGQIQTKGYCAEPELENLLKTLSGKVNSIMLSAVKPISEALLFEIKNSSSNSFVLSSEMEMPFNNLYESPKTVGVDRLALAAGAVFKFPNEPVLIVDVGTCMTFDFIDANAAYHGGAISPGLQMRLKALNAYTEMLPLVDLAPPKDLIGRNTKESILSGVVNGMLKELDGIIDAYKLRYPEMKIILTGGDLAFFDKKLKNSIFADADTLLKGLYFILKQHANKNI
jgi:type III pantothenate kinase